MFSQAYRLAFQAISGTKVYIYGSFSNKTEMSQPRYLTPLLWAARILKNAETKHETFTTVLIRKLDSFKFRTWGFSIGLKKCFFFNIKRELSLNGRPR